jgi:hypothetical protein
LPNASALDTSAQLLSHQWSWRRVALESSLHYALRTTSRHDIQRDDTFGHGPGGMMPDLGPSN